MDQHSSENMLFETKSIVDFIKRWMKPFVIIGIIAAIGSSIVSLLIEPRYQSKALVFPTPTVSISKSLMKEWDDVLKFGGEGDAEQMDQILNSDTLRDMICRKYHLMKRYKIDAKSEYPKLSLKQEYLDRVWVVKSPYNSLEINVVDRSPDTAAFIANDVAAYVDTVRNQIQKERATKVLKIVEEEYLKKKAFVEKLEDSLTTYTDKGIFDYETQSGIIYKQYAKAIASNNASAMKELDAKLKLIGNKGWRYVALRDLAYHERNGMFALSVKYDEARLDAERTLPSKYVFDPAKPSEKKIYPIRWLIVLISTLAAEFFAVIIAMALEALKNRK